MTVSICAPLEVHTRFTVLSYAGLEFLIAVSGKRR